MEGDFAREKRGPILTLVDGSDDEEFVTGGLVDVPPQMVRTDREANLFRSGDA